MKNNKPHFLLIHGAWHGGWVWNEISEILSYQGYSVSTPTLTGLGEKKHLLSSKITIDTFIEDVVNHIIFENLNNIILVGHSFAGSVISGVADKLKDRIEPLFKGEFETGIEPDEWNWKSGRDSNDVTRQICNVWKSDNLIKIG